MTDRIRNVPDANVIREFVDSEFAGDPEAAVEAIAALYASAGLSIVVTSWSQPAGERVASPGAVGQDTDLLDALPLTCGACGEMAVWGADGILRHVDPVDQTSGATVGGWAIASDRDADHAAVAASPRR